MNHLIEQVNPGDLHFDKQNPRIAEFSLGNNLSDQEIIKILWNVMGVEEIVLSIKASSFFEHEPLIAVRENNQLVVIEGNRRLAAVKCLLDPELADYIGINKNSLYAPDNIKDGLKAIPVIIVD